MVGLLWSTTADTDMPITNTFQLLIEHVTRKCFNQINIESLKNMEHDLNV